MKTQHLIINYNNCPCTKGKNRVIVYPLNEESIEMHIPDDVQPANYRIGRLVGQKYHVIYVGRVDSRQDRGLKDRMIEHVGEFTGDCYFEWNAADSILDAYMRECEDYHCWSLYGSLENKIHPRKPDDYTQTMCPVCGQ